MNQVTYKFQNIFQIINFDNRSFTFFYFKTQISLREITINQTGVNKILLLLT